MCYSLWIYCPEGVDYRCERKRLEEVVLCPASRDGEVCDDRRNQIRRHRTCEHCRAMIRSGEAVRRRWQGRLIDW